jgi:hypothetical protein
MGATLANTASSVNIKERLDFSCAVFDGEGRLVANAPHIPVHLGSMGESVATLLRDRAGTMRPGDAFLMNSPYHGGTHLPDLTVITPVFLDESTPLLRRPRHHADVGGITPGSVPPDSRTIEEEGVPIEDWLPARGDACERRSCSHCSPPVHTRRAPRQNLADLLHRSRRMPRGRGSGAPSPSTASMWCAPTWPVQRNARKPCAASSTPWAKDSRARSACLLDDGDEIAVSVASTAPNAARASTSAARPHNAATTSTRR